MQDSVLWFVAIYEMGINNILEDHHHLCTKDFIQLAILEACYILLICSDPTAALPSLLGHLEN